MILIIQIGDLFVKLDRSDYFITCGFGTKNRAAYA
jgi:hypothetical protein